MYTDMYTACTVTILKCLKHRAAAGPKTSSSSSSPSSSSSYSTNSYQLVFREQRSTSTDCCTPASCSSPVNLTSSIQQVNKRSVKSNTIKRHCHDVISMHTIQRGHNAVKCIAERRAAKTTSNTSSIRVCPTSEYFINATSDIMIKVKQLIYVDDSVLAHTGWRRKNGATISLQIF